MNPRVLVHIDYWLGRPLCAALTVVRYLTAPYRAPASGPPRKILFIKFEEQGALVLASDAFRRAAEMVGEENVYCCLFAKNRPILDLLGMIRPGNVLTIDSSGPISALLGAWRVIDRVRHLRIDAIIDLEGFARMSAAFAFLCGGTRRVGWHRFTNEAPFRGNLMTHRVAYTPYLHAAKQFTVLVNALQTDPANIPLMKSLPNSSAWEAPPFHAPKPLVDRVRALLPEVGAPLLIFTPNSSDTLRLRKWPLENYIALGRALRAQMPQCTLLLTGLQCEREACDEIVRALALPDAANLAGRLALDELCALFTLADVLITNDSGPGHFASMTPIHQVILFGPETPQLYGLLGSRARVIYHALACSPCLTALNHRISPCRDNVCINTITIDEVHEEIAAALREREQSGTLGNALRT